eukprot:1541610-Rhodomonas_salina.2
MSAFWIGILNLTNVLFNVIFTFEALLKIFSQGLFRYALQPVNRFDLVLVVFSDVFMVLELFLDVLNISFLRALRYPYPLSAVPNPLL